MLEHLPCDISSSSIRSCECSYKKKFLHCHFFFFFLSFISRPSVRVSAYLIFGDYNLEKGNMHYRVRRSVKIRSPLSAQSGRSKEGANNRSRWPNMRDILPPCVCVRCYFYILMFLMFEFHERNVICLLAKVNSFPLICWCFSREKRFYPRFFRRYGSTRKKNKRRKMKLRKKRRTRKPPEKNCSPLILSIFATLKPLANIYTSYV